MKRLLRNSILFFIGSVFGLIILMILVSWMYLSTFLKSADMSFSEAKFIATSALSSKDQFNDKKITFLVLGLDRRQDSFESTLLTDTIILATLDTETGQLTTLSIPRDLWIDSLKTKVNALYFYGEERSETTGPEFITDEIERITSVPIDYHIVMQYDTLDTLVDLLGGIEITVSNSFTDNLFPNPEYLSDQTKPLYKTVAFQKGTQTMNGTQALSYVRSRHADGGEGSDLARSKRQIQVFNALLDRASETATITNPERLGTLYRFWNDEIQSNITDSEILAIGINSRDSDIVIDAHSIPVGSRNDPDAILTSPAVSKYGLWVWEPKDPTWEKLREYVSDTLP